jgi:hypothetical protein
MLLNKDMASTISQDFILLFTLLKLHWQLQYERVLKLIVLVYKAEEIKWMATSHYSASHAEILSRWIYLMRNKNKISVTIAVTTILLHMQASMPAMGSTQPPIQWVPGALCPGVQWQVLDAEHSLPSAKDENGQAIIPLPHTSSWRDAYLLKHRDNFTFTFLQPCNLTFQQELLAESTQGPA